MIAALDRGEESQVRVILHQYEDDGSCFKSSYVAKLKPTTATIESIGYRREATQYGIRLSTTKGMTFRRIYRVRSGHIVRYFVHHRRQLCLITEEE